MEPETDHYAGNIKIARERFQRCAEATLDRLSAAELNFLSHGMCISLRLEGYVAFLERWKREREAERNGSLKPADDAEWLAFCRAIGALDAAPRRRRSTKTTGGTI